MIQSDLVDLPRILRVFNDGRLLNLEVFWFISKYNHLKVQMEPLFRKADGRLNLTDTSAAFKVKEENCRSPWSRATSPEKVLSSASSAVLHDGRYPDNKVHVLGQYELQFGVFRGQVFKWVAENVLGYAGFLVAAMDKDTASGSRDSKNHNANKLSFKEYIELFPEGTEAIKLKIVKDKSPQPSTSKKLSS
ncbi:hypothetical protein EOD39_6099 [Acipenser ruthenus]|uniref:Uncharacterized protein n=1 Tax=Acipenser ruthenus TaxID=7906 RepID=A0A444UBM2_ACIRT|nr:hypothetical protein EOD39_6099 [Acipenser ruthenus]